MSCGPSEKLKALADQVSAFDDKIDSLIEESPLGKLNDLKSQAGDAVNGIMGKINEAIPEALQKIGDIADRTLHEDISELGKLVLLGVVALPQYKQELDRLQTKWGGIDLGDFKDLDDVASALRSGALDLDRICKLLPNTEKQGVNVVVKGTPISFPDIDPVALVKYGKLPDVRKGKITVATSTRSKKQAEEFLNLQLPEFDF
tara:strand:- start:8420 stop:9028 length:609 start_codon:yes stop_codon:yes gene_type:complete